MSTYNGEKYIREQLDSIQKQSYPNFSLLIRDDGSTDATVAIIREYQKKYSNIRLITGKNLGVCSSFFTLCQKADGQAEYYALADQDDYWLPDKILVAVQRMEREIQKEKKTVSILYAGNKTLVDERLLPIHSEIKYSPNQIPSFGNALVENICTGCTCVMNQALLTKLCHYIPNQVIMHDWWMYLLAASLGKVIYDRHSYLLYRQHGANVYGTMIKKRALWKHRWNELKKKRGRVYRQIETLKRTVPLSLEQKEMADKVLHSQKSIAGKWKLLRDKRIGRQGKGQRMVYMGLVLLGKL